MWDPLVVLLFLVCFAFLGVLFILFATPILIQVGALMEALSVLWNGLGEYFGRPGLFRVCCLLFFLGLIMACVALAALLLAGISCFTEYPAPICRLIGRG